MHSELQPKKSRAKGVLRGALWSVAALVTALILVVGYFRMVVRPGEIRRDCDAQAHQQAAGTGSGTFTAYEQRYGFFYDSCLRSHGRQPEK